MKQGTSPQDSELACPTDTDHCVNEVSPGNFDSKLSIHMGNMLNALILVLDKVYVVSLIGLLFSCHSQ